MHSSLLFCWEFLRTATVWVLVIVGSFVIPCAGADSSRPLLVGSESGFPPYADVDSGGRAVGFSIDLFSAVAKVMAIPAEYRVSDWDTAWSGMVAGKLDALPLVAKIKEREGVLEYTSAHTIGFDGFFVRKDGAHIASIGEASGRRIIVMRSDAGHHALHARGFDSQLVFADTLPDALRMLASGQHDAVLAPLVTGLRIVHELGLADIVEAGPALKEYHREFAFAVKKGDFALRDRLEQGLLIVKASGEYKKIYDRWLGIYDPPAAELRHLAWSGGGLAVTLLIFGTWNWTLRRSRDRLLESESRLRFHTDNSPLAIVEWDANFVVTRWAGAAERIFGWRADEVLGKPIMDLQMVYEEDIPLVQETMRQLTDGVSKAVASKNRNYTRDRKVIFCEWYNSVRSDSRGNMISVMSEVLDITERTRSEEVVKRSESRLRSYFNQPMIGIAITSPEKGWLEVNQRLCEILGYTREELIRLNWAEITHPDDIAGDVAQFERALRGEIDGYSLDKRFMRKDGTTIHVAMSVSCVRTDDGRIGYFVALIQDITERVLLETRTRESQKMEALGTLAGGVAHDFNNALAVILGNVELARQDVGVAHPALESLEEIGKAGRRAKSLVQQILAFGRRQVAERKAIALCPIVQETARLLRTTLPADVNLEVKCTPDVPDVLADATQIEQVLLNLCTNAWHALQVSERAGSIEIRLEPVERDGERFASLMVSDNGRGMDEATRARIFEPFFTTKAVGEGTGLGLSVVHGIVKAHGASIDVRSEPGKGSSFIIHFPAEQPRAANAAGQYSPPVGAGAEEALLLKGDGKRILYVDDDESIVFLVTRLLERQGYRVKGFTNPHAALAEVRASPGEFDLVVTDYNMPGISGLDVATGFREIRADLPVLLASGYITEDLQQMATAAGVRELIYKPSTVDDLCAAVARYANAQSPKKPTS